MTSVVVRVRVVVLLFAVFVGVVVPVPVAAAGGRGWVGRPVAVEALPESLWPPGTGRGYRVRYTSTGADGRPVIVTGAIFVPGGEAPGAGWPVVAWAHGTVGVADPCAPSTAGRSARDVAYLSAWLAAGYAVVATDYEGLGSPGAHPYLNGMSEAHGVIDLVRASRKIDKSIGRRWLAVGQSQGAQAALFTGSLVGKYAPELDFRGAIATGLPSRWRTTAAAVHAFDPGAPAIPEVLLIVAGLHVTHPAAVRPAEYLTALGMDLFARAGSTDCYRDLVPRFAGRRVSEVFAIDAVEQETVLRLMDADAEIPIGRYRQPVFIAQGTEDRVVYPPATQATAGLLQDAGTEVTFRYYPGADHNTTLVAALPDLIAWAGDRMR